MLDNLLSDNQQIQKSNYSQRLPVLEKKIDELQVRVADARRQYREHLKNLARTLLQDRRDTLTKYLGETYLGTERVESKVAPAQTEESTGKS